METLTWYKRLFHVSGSANNLFVYLKYKKDNNIVIYKGYISLLNSLISLRSERNSHNRIKCIEIAERLEKTIRSISRFEWCLLLNIIDDLNQRKCNKYTFVGHELRQLYRRNDAIGRTLFSYGNVYILFSFPEGGNIKAFNVYTKTFCILDDSEIITLVF